MDAPQMIGSLLVGLVLGYVGARLQTRGEIDAELRGILRDATGGIQELAKKVDHAWSHFMQEGPDALTVVTRKATEELAGELYKAERHNDLIATYTAPGAATYEECVAAVRAGQTLHDVIAYRLNLPLDLKGSYDAPGEFDRARSAKEEFNDHRYAYYRATQAKLAPRAERLRLPWGRRRR